MNWLQLSNLQGVSTSPPFTVPLQVDGTITSISWTSTVPTGSKITVQTRLSFTNGADWTEWRTCTNGGSIPDIEPTTKMNHLQVMFRVIMSSTDYSNVPKFNDIAFSFEPVIVIDNKGDVPCKPEVWITKNGNGDFKITNLSNKSDDFVFTGLIDQETAYVDNEQEDIETSLVYTYRYANFNDNYLSLPVGVNILRINGNAGVQFRYQFKYL